jgi:hypothetical protein
MDRLVDDTNLGKSYRPQADCIMFSRDNGGFCAVCRRAIEQVIGLYARQARRWKR